MQRAARVCEDNGGTSEARQGCSEARGQTPGALGLCRDLPSRRDGNGRRAQSRRQAGGRPKAAGAGERLLARLLACLLARPALPCLTARLAGRLVGSIIAGLADCPGPCPPIIAGLADCPGPCPLIIARIGPASRRRASARPHHQGAGPRPQAPPAPLAPHARARTHTEEGARAASRASPPAPRARPPGVTRIHVPTCPRRCAAPARAPPGIHIHAYIHGLRGTGSASRWHAWLSLSRPAWRGPCCIAHEPSTAMCLAPVCHAPWHRALSPREGLGHSGSPCATGRDGTEAGGAWVMARDDRVSGGQSKPVAQTPLSFFLSSSCDSSMESATRLREI